MVSRLFFATLLSFGVASTLCGCRRELPLLPETVAQPTVVLKGVSLSPKSPQGTDFTEFLNNVQQTGDILTWAGDWRELSNIQTGTPDVIASRASTYRYIPVIEVQFFDPSTGELLRPLDDSTKISYRNSIVDFADFYRPAYIGVGVEVNILYEKHQQEFDLFVQFYDEVYGAIKNVSPATKVFTIFQLERMKGLRGGLLGGANDTTDTEWFLLNRFPRLDLAVFTSYPGMIYRSPTEIPSRYYADISLHTTKRIAFTELGWHSEASPQGWESSESEQSQFVTVLLSAVADLDREFLVWTFMYDQDTAEPFRSMGLRRRSDGVAKLAWQTWINNR